MYKISSREKLDYSLELIKKTVCSNPNYFRTKIHQNILIEYEFLNDFICRLHVINLELFQFISLDIEICEEGYMVTIEIDL